MTRVLILSVMGLLVRRARLCTQTEKKKHKHDTGIDYWALGQVTSSTAVLAKHYDAIEIGYL